ncbi:MAG: hypothetical protein O7A69_02590 [SAR324 cluster bacterium]|nr:hypothetical protein [SAR324 cluster bacterium]
MPHKNRMDYFSGSGRAELNFGDLDLNYRLKTRAFIDICMPPMFTGLERRFPMLALRKVGIAPIMYYVDLQAGAAPLAFGWDVRSSFSVSIQRAMRGSAAEGGSRLFLDMRSTLQAHLGSGSAAALGFEKEKGALTEVGSCQVVQVITRPLAPPGERAVTELPEELGEFNLLEWDAPYPNIALMHEAPGGYRQAVVEAAPRFDAIWGLCNTDINQHVNVHEYIMAAENHFNRLAHLEGLPLERHRIRRIQMVFRQPFFPGQAYGVDGRLWLNGAESMFTGGVYAIGADGGWASAPNVATRCEGELMAE